MNLEIQVESVVILAGKVDSSQKGQLLQWYFARYTCTDAHKYVEIKEMWENILEQPVTGRREGGG